MRSLNKQQVRSLMKTAGGSSYIITLPIALVKELGWQEKQKLVVTKYGDGMIIKDWSPGKRK